MSSKEYILWVDLETTGLDPVDDYLLEIAAIITDFDGNRIGSPFRALVHCNVRNAILRSDEYVKEMHEKNGLWLDLWNSNSVYTLNQIEFNMSKWLSDAVDFDKDKPIIYIGGSSVSFDRSVIAAKLPKVSSMLTYRIVDVTSIKLMFENSLGHSPKPYEDYGRVDHRAMDDIMNSLDEYFYYVKILDSERGER